MHIGLYYIVRVIFTGNNIGNSNVNRNYYVERVNDII